MDENPAIEDAADPSGTAEAPTSPSVEGAGGSSGGTWPIGDRSPTDLRTCRQMFAGVPSSRPEPSTEAFARVIRFAIYAESP